MHPPGQRNIATARGDEDIVVVKIAGIGKRAVDGRFKIVLVGLAGCHAARDAEMFSVD